MRNLKKFLALVLAMMMTLSLMVTVNAASEPGFSDGVAEEFTEAVDVLNGMGVFEGYEDGNFHPQNTITRAQMAAIVYRLATGDADDVRADLYKEFATFDDVDNNAWYAGYVGYCSDAQFIMGYGDNSFKPGKAVTGYEALAMILRAVGYGKGGEFEGSSWRINVGSRATSEGLLRNVNNTIYEGTLNQPAPRELVAELAFRAANIPTVTYSPALGYNKYTTSVTVSGQVNNYNLSLGEKNYGLAYNIGIVVGNEATGEDYTLVGMELDNNNRITGAGSYTYVSADTSNVTLAYAADTSLDYFGHQVKIWYDYRSYDRVISSTAANNGAWDAVDFAGRTTDFENVYHVIDQATAAEIVYSNTAVLSGGTNELGTAAKDAGFSVATDSTAYKSAIYQRIDTSGKAATADTSNVKMYSLVSNNSKKTVDVIIALEAEVAQITEKNTTVAKPTVTLGASGKNGYDSAFTTFNPAQNGVLLVENLTEDSVTDLGKVVTAWQIKGTTDTATNLATKQGDWMYRLEAPMETVVGTVSSYKINTNWATEITLTAGTTLKRSGITEGQKVIDDCLLQLGDGTTAGSATAPDNEKLTAGVTYTFYLDKLGRFVGAEKANDFAFLYSTFADYDIGGLGTGTIEYGILGVDWDGKIQPVQTITKYDDAGTGAFANINGTEYNKLTVTRKDQGGNTGSGEGNELLDGYNTGYMIDGNGRLTTAINDGTTQMVGAGDADTGTPWTITSTDAANGFKKVNNYEDTTGNGTADANVEYLLTNNTKFIVVSGAGTSDLKVTEYNGLKELVGSGSSAVITYASAGSANGTDNCVYFKTGKDMYGSAITDANNYIAVMILSDKNLANYTTTNVFYTGLNSVQTGVELPGEDGASGTTVKVQQYAMWAGTEKGYYFVDTGTTTAGLGYVNTIENDNFYTLTKLRETNGIPVYGAKVVTTINTQANNGTCNNATSDYNTTYDLQYKYITVNNANTADIGNETFLVGDAKVVDVEYQNDPITVGATRNEITSVEELNHAISVRKPNGTDAVYKAWVAIVNDGVNVSTIYVYNLANNP